MNNRSLGAISLLGALLIFILSSALSFYGVRVNLTDSAPHGIWVVRAFEATKLRRGLLVDICPPTLPITNIMKDRGYLGPGQCNGVMPLLKPVVAISGDVVSVTKSGVMVNGKLLSNSSSLNAIPGVPCGTYKVKSGEVWVISSYSSGSFDSRYFGPVNLSGINGVADPVYVFGDVSKITEFAKVAE